jgi:multiple sugar transport system permease protein
MRGPKTGLLSWGFAGPTLLLLLAFNIYPLVWNVALAFRSANLVGGSGAPVGVANYARVFTDPQYGDALRLTARFVGLAVGASSGT